MLSGIFWVNVIFFVVFCGFALLFRYFSRSFKYWERRHVFYQKPMFGFGSVKEIVFGTMSYTEFMCKTYWEGEGHRYMGLWIGGSPALFLRDIEVINEVLSRNFDCFYHRGVRDDVKLDPLNFNFILMSGELWKFWRGKTGPFFMPNRLASLIPKIVLTSKIFADKLDTSSSTVNIKTDTMDYAIKLMGEIVMGVPHSQLSNEDSIIYSIVKDTFKANWLLNIRTLSRIIWPSFPRLVKWKRFKDDYIDFLRNLVRGIMNDPEKEKCNNVLSFLIHEQKLSEGVSLTELAANTYGVFAAGVETTGSVLAYALFELSKNQDMQEKLYNEISSVLPKHGNEPTFDALKDFKYLDQVLSETLRKYPPLQATSRECTKEYKFPDSDFTVEKGIKVVIPILALHYDPAYFPDPHKFDPERFSDENKAKIIKGSYLPFGDGPRGCLGQRLAKIELKVALITLLMRFKFSINRKMIQPLTFRPRSIFLVPKHPILLDVTPRTNDEINKNL